MCECVFVSGCMCFITNEGNRIYNYKRKAQIKNLKDTIFKSDYFNTLKLAVDKEKIEMGILGCGKLFLYGEDF